MADKELKIQDEERPAPSTDYEIKLDKVQRKTISIAKNAWATTLPESQRCHALLLLDQGKHNKNKGATLEEIAKITSHTVNLLKWYIWRMRNELWLDIVYRDDEEE